MENIYLENKHLLEKNRALKQENDSRRKSEMNFKTSLDEYTNSEIEINGNGVYGGKRHDEICDYLQSSYNLNETQINDISMGIWLAIQSERRVSSKKIEKLKDRITELEEEKNQKSRWHISLAKDLQHNIANNLIDINKNQKEKTRNEN